LIVHGCQPFSDHVHQESATLPRRGRKRNSARYDGPY